MNFLRTLRSFLSLCPRLWRIVWSTAHEPGTYYFFGAIPFRTAWEQEVVRTTVDDMLATQLSTKLRIKEHRAARAARKALQAREIANAN